MAPSKVIHVLMVTLPYHGHINPMIRFAELLTPKGIHVTLATTEHAHDSLMTKVTKPDLVEFEFFADGLAVELDRYKNIGVLIEEYLPRDGAKNLSQLIHNLEEKGKKFSCIITNCFVPWVANVATTHDIPCAMLWIQSCATYSIYYHYFKDPSIFPSMNDKNNAIKIPGLPLLKVEDLPTFILPTSPPHFLNLVSTTIKSLDRFRWVFGSSFCEIEENLVNSMSQFKPIYPIGPLVSPSILQNVDYQKGEGEDLCINWLNKQPDSSVLYIALGSISVLSQNETKALATTLECDHTRRYLWIRKKGDDGWGRQTGELPEDFVEKTKDRGLLVPWCEQDKVLKHPAIKCFLTHCGWNSTLETIAAGVPVIAYPDWTDQVTNAKLLVDVFNMGVRMRKSMDGELKKEEIERCIVELTEGPRALAMKEQAIHWKNAAKKATLIGGSSYEIIDNFVSELRGRSNA